MSKQDEQKTISAKLQDLQALVDWFEGEDFQLETALNKHAEAKKLAEEIEADLTEFKNKINVLDVDFSKE